MTNPKPSEPVHSAEDLATAIVDALLTTNGPGNTPLRGDRLAVKRRREGEPWSPTNEDDLGGRARCCAINTVVATIRTFAEVSSDA